MANRVLRVVFMGTPDFSVAALRSILAGPHEVVCVYTRPPRPRGRGQQVQKSPVHIVAEERGIPVRHPLSFKKDAQAVADFAALGADVAVVAAYGLILPGGVLAAPVHGCLNIHASLLPRWRGASPIQRAILAGDLETGITIMQMEEGLDTGPMVLKQSVPITEMTTTPELHDTLAALGGGMIADALDRLAETGRLEAERQDDARATYAALLTKEDGRVDWTQGAAAIARQVRALNPWPGVWSVTDNGARIKILAAEPAAGPGAGAPGECVDRNGMVVCGGSSALKLLRVQPENGRPMDGAAAVNGGYLTPGRRLGQPQG